MAPERYSSFISASLSGYGCSCSGPVWWAGGWRPCRTSPRAHSYASESPPLSLTHTHALNHSLTISLSCMLIVPLSLVWFACDFETSDYMSINCPTQICWGNNFWCGGWCEGKWLLLVQPGQQGMDPHVTFSDTQPNHSTTPKTKHSNNTDPQTSIVTVLISKLKCLAPIASAASRKATETPYWISQGESELSFHHLIPKFQVPKRGRIGGNAQHPIMRVTVKNASVIWSPMSSKSLKLLRWLLQALLL